MDSLELWKSTTSWSVGAKGIVCLFVVKLIQHAVLLIKNVDCLLA